MADEPEKTETDTPETAAPEAAASEAAAPEAAAPAEEAAAPEAAAPAEKAAAPAAATPAAPAEPEVQLSPKERRQTRRQAAVTKRGSRRASTPEERIERRKKAAEERRRYRARLKQRKAGAPAADTTPTEPTPGPEHTGRPKTRQGIVSSDKAEKTITVKINMVRRHRRYQKILRSTETLHVHDERNDAHVGDTVLVVECRPMSRSKRWRLVEVVERAK